MATRQYVGARYVTKIYENSLDPSSAEWEAGVNYEPLTMVTYNNGSYLSKKTVPGSVGDPSTNPDYWAQTGFYNGQIAYLQNQIDAINAGLDPILHKRYIFIADSYGAQPTPATSWESKAAQFMGLTEGDDVFSLYAGGFGFIGGSGITPGDYKFLSLLQTNANYITDHDTITDIVVMGGTNDWAYTSADIATAISDFVTYCQSEYPLAEIHVGMPSVWYNSADWEANDTRILMAYRAAAIHDNVDYITDIEKAIRGTLFVQADKIHPSSVGSTFIGQSVANFLKGKSTVDVGYVGSLSNGWANVTATASGNASALPSMRTRYLAGMLELVTASPFLTLSTAITTNGAPQEIGTLTDCAFMGADNNFDTFTVANLSDPSGNTYTANVLLKNGKLCLGVTLLSGGVPQTLPAGNYYLMFRMIVNPMFN